MAKYNYNTKAGFKSVKSMLITIAGMWILVLAAILLAPSIKWHSIIIGGVATLYIIILYATRLPRLRKFRIAGPLNVDGRGVTLNALANGENTDITLGYGDMTRVRYFRESLAVHAGGRKYNFQKICFDDKDKFRSFAEKVVAEYSERKPQAEAEPAALPEKRKGKTPRKGAKKEE